MQREGKHGGKCTDTQTEKEMDLCRTHLKRSHSARAEAEKTESTLHRDNLYYLFRKINKLVGLVHSF